MSTAPNPTGPDEPTDERPLAGIRVLDLTRALAGPYATLLLAGLGAEVIKIEDPLHGDLARENSPYLGARGVVVERRDPDDVSLSHLTRSRGKSGVTLDLKNPMAAEVFADLVAGCDVVVENFTAGTARRLGVDYERVRELNPRVVYLSLSGFGQDDKAGSKAMDVLVQALSGVMYTSGEAGEPPVRLGIPVADMLAPVFGVIGILAALERRHRTGEGDWVDVSMLGALTSFVAIENWGAMAAAGMEARTGRTVHRLSPFGVFECRDGHVAIVAVHDKLATGLFTAMGDPGMAEDDRYRTRDRRVSNARALEARIEEWTRSLPMAEVLALLEAQGVPAAPVRTPEEAFADPGTLRRQEAVPVVHPVHGPAEGLHTAGVPITFTSGRVGFDDVLPLHLGQHNDDVYGGLLGYDAEKLRVLRERGVI
ncbi:CoA transferase [Modestobacter sp. VKM Ac-2986]|uniref:CaiB/BaiF CoA transferase family protein n=1 Tax=Modestobacter sp. VKM Ac-2986 TaxID=3004140 RepID=UPI0022AAF80A|nr:CoA transferase [Modestobacter sp. VKM Ac-2986]MCZ2828853.1 CoA transferase [Modestobacter sp. VKM Ac-2986]